MIDISIDLPAPISSGDSYLSRYPFEETLPPLSPHSHFYLERMYNVIGSDVVKQSAVTQIQKHRYISIALLASSVAIAIFASYPLLAVSAGVCGLHEAKSFFVTDLDNLATLSKVRSQMHKRAFKDVASSFSIDQIVRYDLLADVTAFNTSYEKAQIYADIKDLFDQKVTIQDKIKIKSFELRCYYARHQDISLMHLDDYKLQIVEKNMENLIQQRYIKILEGTFLSQKAY
jgi:hypothetical protein